MKSNKNSCFKIDSDSLYLIADSAPWDSEIFGCSVAAISIIDVKKIASAQNQFEQFKIWISDNSIQIVSSRLSHEQIDVSMFLERNNFRFVEMVLHPLAKDLQNFPVTHTDMFVEPVIQSELLSVISMAERSFSFERYHIDPRIDSQLANLRYGRWIRNSFYDSKQELLKVMLSDGHIVAFFVVENRNDSSVYWHLTAVNPDYQGKKLGYNIWMTMINYHKTIGMDSIFTTISARNTPVLNLYSKLNFRFTPPEMTFHWIKSDQ